MDGARRRVRHGCISGGRLCDPRLLDDVDVAESGQHAGFGLWHARAGGAHADLADADDARHDDQPDDPGHGHAGDADDDARYPDDDAWHADHPGHAGHADHAGSDHPDANAAGTVTRAGGVTPHV